MKEKWRNANTSMKVLYILVLICYWCSYGFLVYSLLHLVGIEDLIRYCIIGGLGIIGILYTIFALKKMTNHKKVGYIVLTILAILLSIVMGGGAYYINKIYTKLENITAKDTSTYTTVLLSLKDIEFTDSSKIGMITDEDDKTGYILPLEFMKNENMSNEIEYYGTYAELLDALYSKKVDAIFITKDYPTIYGNDDKYSNIVNETKEIKEYSKELKNDESTLLASTKSLTEPFTILVLGVDSESTDGLDANAAFNGDTLLMITFNPKTLTATMLSVPRDMYVPIISGTGRNLGYSKINASAAYGTASTINTLESITGIDIDYFVKVDFQGVIDLVNALGGIDVDVEQPDYSAYVANYGEGVLCESNSLRDLANLVCMNTGMQHLTGEQALAYARNRHGFLESDIARNRHQQQIIEAVAKKLTKTANLSEFETILDTISKNIATNMKTSQMLSFYSSIKGMINKAVSGDDFITIQKTQLSYYSLSVGGLSCLGYYQGSMDAITEAMKENLGIVTIKTVKTMAYDYTTDYNQDTTIIGKGITTGSKLVMMQDFTGDSVSTAKAFANKYNLTLNVEYVDEPGNEDGIILRQNVSSYTLVSSISSFTIYVQKSTSTNTNTNTNTNTETTTDTFKVSVATHKTCAVVGEISALTESYFKGLLSATLNGDTVTPDEKDVTLPDFTTAGDKTVSYTVKYTDTEGKEHSESGAITIKIYEVGSTECTQ